MNGERSTIDALNLPFDEAIEFFRQKVNLPTRTWHDLWEGMHSRAFVVAGAMKSELLSDLRAAVDSGISEGTTLKEFRENFSDIVRRHGWKYKGGKAWRTAVIFNTNLSVAYHTGHYKQMTDPDVLKVRPLWRYVASSAADPRPEHMAWYNTVLPADDPWWKTHYPPNGWGCHCGVVSHSAREVEELKREGVGIREERPDDGYYEWTNPDTGEAMKIPDGIDPGWAYNPGETAWGKRLSDEAMKAWRAQGGKAWERLVPANWKVYGRPEKIHIDVPVASVGPPAMDVSQLRSAIVKALGTEEQTFSFTSGKFRYDILADADTLSQHLKLDRAPFVPFIREALEDPFEVWLSFERHKGTGKYVLRQRVIKAVKLDKNRAIFMVIQSKGGFMEAWTMIPTSKLGYVNRQRQGKLIWARE